MKNQIRHTIKKKIKDISRQKKQEYSFHIAQKIIEKFWHLDTWHIYASMKDEVDTKPLIDRLQTNDKKIFFAPTDNLESRIENLESLDIIIVPWRAFTRDGKRLWRGWGRYDRFLVQHPKAKKIWICLPEQIVEKIPQESHDIIMDDIITD